MSTERSWCSIRTSTEVVFFVEIDAKFEFLRAALSCQLFRAFCCHYPDVLYNRGSFTLHVHARTHALIKVWLIPTIPYALIKKCALNNDVRLLTRVYGMLQNERYM